MKTEETDAVRAVVRTSQIIVGAMVAGVAFFCVLATTVLSDAGRPGPPAKPDVLGLPLITAMSLGFGVISIVASLVVPRVMVEGGLRAIAKGPSLDDMKLTESGQRQVYPASDVGRLLPLFQTQLIVASALNEGGAFFGALAYMIERQAAALAVAGTLVALLLSRFPTLDRVQGWLDAQLERLSQLRRDEFSTGP
ncbi:MAG: hypothetical protein BGO49_13125 [Planctomycetales bacterium 71-10]|nr:MAG: hypothetical protein BGO49_13125 [Planctomycetales bacterium 71-10]